jgi:hypothetical protein
MELPQDGHASRRCPCRHSPPGRADGRGEPHLGYTRIQGARASRGRSTIARIHKAHGMPPAAERPTSWRLTMKRDAKETSAALVAGALLGGTIAHDYPVFARDRRAAMMRTMALESLRRYHREILAMAARHGARNVRVFGSIARAMIIRRATSISLSISNRVDR